MIISPKIRNLKFRNKLLLSFLIVFVPLILMSKALIFVQSQKLIEAIIEKELNQSATLLKDLIQTTADISIENRLKAITVFKFRNNGYAFIVNEKGNAVMHPFLQGKNLLAQPEAFSAIIQKILNEKSGKIKTFGLSVPDTRSGEQLVIFRYLPQYKWIIGAANYVDEIYTPLSTFSTLITLDILFFLLIFVVLAYLLSRSVTKPLENFTHILNNSKGDDYSIRLNYNAQDEIGSLARHFNTLMTRIKKYHDQLNDQRQKTIAAQNALKTNELKRAEKERRKILIQLEKAQKMEAIGTLAGGIAHDFNNILSSIFGYAQLAQMNLNNPEKLNNHMNQILKGAQRASDLVKQILTFSRQTKNQKSPLKLHLVVKEALKLLRSSIPTTIGMVTRVETRDMVNADPTQMHQMIMNLCTNAYHAMTTSGGTLTVSLDTVDQIAQAHQNKDYFQPGPFLKLMVKDTGNGMNQEAIEKAFDPYFTTKEMDRLALVRAIVEDHKGFSCIENITGHGTSVFVYLPVITKNDSSADSRTGIDASLKTGKETIMVVDDEPDILALIEELLNRFGYSVHLFNNGKSALNAYQEGKISFDMVITDMTMPHMTGIALAEAILSENKNMPIILCSGYIVFQKNKLDSLGR
ncbi:response regulator [Desulfobacter sp.]|uniref:hybrid sensor histidine kinase/response regulator n=1 Tax=Desulfobacter sp. TaxID=2294 RepID=UPI003D0BB418